MCFGFNFFYSWNVTIINSTNISISMNGVVHGYFSCSIGVKQGHPLSPLLFCIAEDVLIRNLSRLVETRNLKLRKATRISWFPPTTSMLMISWYIVYGVRKI